ncbi:acyl carrier protein [Erwinia tracheiphila]|uniref:acyl carrier protein n=1 Tax=Erwinia tracheiphila TaxID=65700 RepID=UPI001F190E04|nr:acyl carrier protein [Erwinia tracheiphila]UIA83685.1 acyl carrier protein [Erwinia tracheiphila]UIA92267.1 acyl carrier protein [Erwinia tracheiphila]
MDTAHDKQRAFLALCKMIQLVNGRPADQIGIQESLVMDLEMDSVELIDLLIKLEEYGVKIDESEITSTLTVEHLTQRLMFSGQCAGHVL